MSKIIGVNTRCYPSENPAVDGEIETRAVLVEGEIGDYACYVGHGSPEFVKRLGNKISFEEACCHFPSGQLKKEKYRA